MPLSVRDYMSNVEEMLARDGLLSRADLGEASTLLREALATGAASQSERAEIRHMLTSVRIAWLAEAERHNSVTAAARPVKKYFLTF